MIEMVFKKMLKVNFWKIDIDKFQELYDYDLRFNASFRGKEKLSHKEMKMFQIKYLKYYHCCPV